MGALWKVRKRLKKAHGAVAGRLAADTLFNAWMNAYDDGSIDPIIEVHWLTLDDDDGKISNGTPNYEHIDGGFVEQCWPGYPLPRKLWASIIPKRQSWIQASRPWLRLMECIPC